MCEKVFGEKLGFKIVVLCYSMTAMCGKDVRVSGDGSVAVFWLLVEHLRILNGM